MGKHKHGSIIPVTDLRILGHANGLSREFRYSGRIVLGKKIGHATRIVVLRRPITNGSIITNILRVKEQDLQKAMICPI